MKTKSATLHSAALVLLIASGAAMAEVDVYGKVNVTVQNSDEAGDSNVELRSNASRFGVKGSEDLENGLKAIYQFEWEVDPTDNANSSDDHIKARNQFVGLTGFFGTVKAGRHDTALKLAQGDFDLFNDLEGDIKNIVNGENRESNFIGYTTPVFADAFSVTVNFIPGEEPGVDADGDGTVEDGIAEGTSFSLNYETDALYAAIARDADIDGLNIDTTRFVGGYKFGAAQLNVLYQQTDADGVDGDAVGASFAYKLGDSNTLKLQHVQGDIHETGLVALDAQTSVGVDHKLGRNTKLFGFYTTGDIAETDESRDYFGVGIEHKF